MVMLSVPRRPWTLIVARKAVAISFSLKKVVAIVPDPGGDET